MKTLDLNQLGVETFNIDSTESSPIQPIIFTDGGDHCAYTASLC